MENPYKPPSSELKDQPAASDTGLLPFILGMVFAVLSAFIPTAVTPSFKEVFDAFGAFDADGLLPRATILFLACHRLFWLLPILVIVVRFSCPEKRKLPLWLGIFSLAFTIPLSMWALYQPIFDLGVR